VAHKFCLCREEAARTWRKREAEWEREVKAREKLMAEVPATQCMLYLTEGAGTVGL